MSFLIPQKPVIFPKRLFLTITMALLSESVKETLMEEVKVFPPSRKASFNSVHVVNLTCVSFRYILLLLVLFAIPGLVMIVAYGLISRELYRGIHFEMSHRKDATGEHTSMGNRQKGFPKLTK